MLDQNYSQPFQEPVQDPQPRSPIVRIILIVLLALLLILGIWFGIKKFGGSTSPSLNQSPEGVVPTSSEENIPVVDPFPDDKDRDGINDEKEKEMGLSNRDFDTDGDGLSDADEINVWKTDPKVSDTDGDGFGDGYEVMSDYNPLGEGKLP